MSVSATQQRVLKAEQAIREAETELAEAKAARDVALARAGWLKLPAIDRDDVYENPTHYANPMLSVNAVVQLVAEQEQAA